MTDATTFTVGMDLGTESSKVVLGSHFSCEIVRSPAGLCSTPTAVSFHSKTRQIGETAQLKGNNAVVGLNRLLLGAGPDFLQDFNQFERASSDDPSAVTVDYNGNPQKNFSSSALLAMLLSNLHASEQATVHRVMSGKTMDSAVKSVVVLAVPPHIAQSPNAAAQLLDAAYAAGLDRVALVESSVALAAAYERKFTPTEGTTKVVFIVDMGHAETCVNVVQFGSDATASTGASDCEGKDTPAASFQVLSSQCDPNLGAASIDVRLWHHFQSSLPALKSVQPNSRAGQRLLAGCSKLKHLLSQLPEGTMTVENVGANDTDVQLTATRLLLAEICLPEAQALTGLLEVALKDASLAVTDMQVDSVEVLGGGCRIPWVQTVLQDVLNTMTLARSLDDTSAAMGAALVGEMPEVQQQALLVAVLEQQPDGETLARREQLRQQERSMHALDLDESMKAELRNQIEAKVLQLQSAKHNSKHSALLPNDKSLDLYLEELDEWIFSEECDNSSRAEMEQKVADVNTKVGAMCSAYYAALQAEQQAKEADMEAEAKRAQLEAAANGEDNPEDHDNRRLPKKRRMEIVMKNKEEANELFKDGNWKFAAARYTKALTHCSKFVDLSPDDIAEVTALKLTLNLNLALAHMKLENTDQALRVCNEAVSLGNDTSIKAFYRRASVFYEKKRWNDAKQDLIKAKALLGGEEDKAIAKLGERIEAQLKRDKEKEKKMASKMFG